MSEPPKYAYPYPAQGYPAQGQGTLSLSLSLSLFQPCSCLILHGGGWLGLQGTIKGLPYKRLPSTMLLLLPEESRVFLKDALRLSVAAASSTSVAAIRPSSSFVSSRVVYDSGREKNKEKVETIREIRVQPLPGCSHVDDCTCLYLRYQCFSCVL
ncbi:hypothetical protein EUGRSUZ_I00607 [Eucalyptus grandis]|uniref:Uncharacterized protein n=2 Tax=Eucalyptus grandis TaxID=71139 RepID=A0ACC3JD54_EUCGR|nr:hypothetical protein EUGRSUZ_I00607 [Eucalyptus grandis]